MKMSQLLYIAMVCSIIVGTIVAVWVRETTRDTVAQRTAKINRTSGLMDTTAKSSENSADDNEPRENTRPAGSRRQGLMAGLTIFMLAIFIGFEMITKVPPTLHTPLMSGSNAISGITLVGAVIVAGSGAGLFSSLLGMFAVALATVNAIGGFLVTHRMLAMFKKK